MSGKLSGALQIELQGEQLWLLPERALYWPNGKILFVADTHFGKDATFRRHGMTVPAGTDAHDLQRLSDLCADTAVEQLVILGDFVHAEPRDDDPFPALFTAWRASHQSLHLAVVGGNHDARISGRMFNQQLQWLPEASEIPPFCLCHEPPLQKTARYALAGHLHPVVRLRTRSDAARLPVFWQQPNCLVLPAFGSFTGGLQVRAAADDMLYGIVPDAVVALTI